MNVRKGYTIVYNGRVFQEGVKIPPEFLEEIKKVAWWRLEDDKKERVSTNREIKEEREEKREEITEDYSLSENKMTKKEQILNRAMLKNSSKVR